MAPPTLSLTGKQWLLHDALDLPLTELAAALAQRRSIHDAPAHDPAAFTDAPLAAARILQAIDQHEHVGIFGDYDCDGITATAQLTRMFLRRNVTPHTLLPHRARDGYGLKTTHVDAFHKAGVQLLITADTGITAVEEVAYAVSLGMDVIITDHHSPLMDAKRHILLPPALAIVHPLRAPDLADPAPAAAGVAYALVSLVEGEPWADQDTDLTLAMMGTVADLVPVTGANRRLVQEGLAAAQRLRTGPVAALLAHAGGKHGVTALDIAFRIAPRINAAGRMADPAIALRALLEGGDALDELATLNAMRQDATAQAVAHALHLMQSTAAPACITMMSASYAPGIVGLIAGKITEQTGLPSMAAHIDGDTCTASLRSVEQYNIVEALHRHAHLLLRYGGHAQAAGATFRLQDADALRIALEQDAAAHIPEDQRHPSLSIDAHLRLCDVQPALCRSLSALEPYGQGNAEPLFLLSGVHLRTMRRVGGDGTHLQARVDQTPAIAFGLGHLLERIHGPVDLACRIGINEWNGTTQAQLMISDIRQAL